MLYRTGMDRTSHSIPITLARICPGIGDGVIAVILNVSRRPPACRLEEAAIASTTQTTTEAIFFRMVRDSFSQPR
jgi:hypothetical protein